MVHLRTKELWTRHGVLHSFVSLSAISLLLFLALPRALLLIATTNSPTPAPIGAPASNCSRKNTVGSSSDSTRVELLLKYWQDRYFGSNGSAIKPGSGPRAPHIENCSEKSRVAIAWDTRDASGKRPSWALVADASKESGQNQDSQENSLHPKPPWVEGGDDDNLPMTRRAQADLWLHQHPENCSHESTRFLVNDWVNSPRLGIGGQMVAMAGIFAIAVNEKRVLVTEGFNRADHDDCKGSSRAHWSCYFVPETSEECRAQAMKLASQKRAWKKRIVTNANAYDKEAMWFGRVPENWGRPWETMQPLDIVDNKILTSHKAADRQWWRAQALRYLMRAPSEYLCTQLNIVRHQAFGRSAAKLVAQTLPEDWPSKEIRKPDRILDKIWIKSKPWLPRPLLSVHIRQGDKASEMKIYDFKSYMDLAGRIQDVYPQLQDIWLSTEMQNVIDESRSYPRWRFYYTDVARQSGTTSMREYESSLGRKASSNNAFVNFMMAVECDYFVGALGSTWSFLIDGMRVTGGKLKAAFFSVNKDRYW